MKIDFSISEALSILSRTPQVLTALLKDLPMQWTHNTEGENTWSPFDIVGHLIHGEKTDWIRRMRIILSVKKDKKFEPFDMDAHFSESEGKNMNELLREFEELRIRNMELLKMENIEEAELTHKGIHPAFGEVTLRQLLSTWVVHDLSHIAQISRVMAKQYSHEVGPWKEYLPVLMNRT